MTSVLVYPYIVPDSDWLKIAALCWDKVHRINARASSDPEDLAELNEKLGGFLESVYPEEFSSGETAEAFRKWLMHGAKLSAEATGNHPSDYFAMFTPKLPTNPAVMSFLKKHDLLRHRGQGPHEPGDQGDAVVRKDIALHYLSLAASNIARGKNLDLFAESGEFTQSLAFTANRLGAAVSTQILEAYLPDNLTGIELHRLADLREAMAMSRLRYHKDVDALVQEYGKLASEGDLLALRQRVVDIATQRIEDTKATYRNAKVGGGAKLLGISLGTPALMTGIASMLGVAVFTPAAVAAGLTLGIIPILTERDKAGRDWRASGWSYVWDLQERIDALRMATNLTPS